MGLAMAGNVLRAGFTLSVYNRTSHRAAPLVAAGAREAGSPAELGACDVVVTMVSDGAAARSILVENGVLEALRPGAIVLEMSTIGPTCARELARDAAHQGVQLLDAPVSGSVSVAEAAQLFAMVGGDAAAYQQVTPVLDAMTKGHLLLGPSGAGAAMKLALNSMIAATNESVAETLAFARRCGIDPERAYGVLAGGALASPFVSYKRAAFLRPGEEPAAFTTALMLKDMTLVKELARQVGARMPVAEAATGVLTDAVGQGLGDEDMASVLQLLEADQPVDLTTSREDS
jgi:3-hydroxyisobutyrate dehydrogenase-like beta-hydroxyacid dehydrogenase